MFHRALSKYLSKSHHFRNLVFVTSSLRYTISNVRGRESITTAKLENYFSEEVLDAFSALNMSVKGFSQIWGTFLTVMTANDCRGNFTLE